MQCYSIIGSGKWAFSLAGHWFNSQMGHSQCTLQ
uniref:Uncharacterized protein n=1 Tax=Anguilla anguilla TaxID=7936 RepID=A0A0E9S7J9_ANGAN